MITYEEAAVGGDGDDNDRDSGFDLQPEVHPDRVNKTIGEVCASNTDNGYDHGEYAEGQNGAEDEFTAEGNADAPEKGNRDGNYYQGKIS